MNEDGQDTREDIRVYDFDRERPIFAIKWIRDVTHARGSRVGLREAKEAIDDLKAGHEVVLVNVPTPIAGLARSAAKSCGVVLERPTASFPRYI